MTSAMEAVTRLHPITPRRVSPFVREAYRDFLTARKRCLTSTKDRDAIAALSAFVKFQRALADWQDGA